MIKRTRNTKDELYYRTNDEIYNYDSVRIIGDNVESKIVTLSEAKKIAESMELDLVEINNKTKPPILKICSYEKMIYEQKKLQKKNKQQATQIKEIQLSVNIAKHDLETKAKKATEFLEDGHKVKVVLTMKGRELTRREENKRSILEFIVMLEDVASCESNIKDEGNKTMVILKKKK